MSICQVYFDKHIHSLEISVKTFADDLLLGLEKGGITKVYLGEEKENSKTDDYIYNYIISKISIMVNGKKN